jgi:hypothetical protein
VDNGAIVDHVGRNHTIDRLSGQPSRRFIESTALRHAQVPPTVPRTAALGGAVLRQVEPRQLLVPEKVLGGLQQRRIVERSDVEVRFGRQSRDFTGQGGTALPAETAHRAGGRVEFGDLAAGHDVGAVIEANEHGNRRAAMLSAALTMTPENRLGLTGGGESDCATQTTALELFHERPLAFDNCAGNCP